MSFVGPVNLLSHRGNYCSIFSIKDFSVSHAKQNNILLNLAYIATFEELSRWVEINSDGQKYIACPANTSYEDRNSCLNTLQDLILQAIKGINKRKDGRDLKLIKASQIGDYYTIASILSSAAWTYWQTYLLSSGNAAFYSENRKKNEQKIELQKFQIEHVGAAVDFRKALKKDALQEILDFDETEEILKNNFFEDKK